VPSVPCKRQVLNGHPLFSLFLTNDSVDIGFLSITHSASTVVYFWYQRISNTSKQMYSTVNCIYFTIFSVFMCVHIMTWVPPRFPAGVLGRHNLLAVPTLLKKLLKVFYSRLKKNIY